MQDRKGTSSQKRGQAGYFESLSDVQGSFKLSHKRQSWLGIASAPSIAARVETDHGVQSLMKNSKGRCC